ncbi:MULTISPECIES: hypothetical protein [Limnospira]|uniref:hypothetical protein n=1 Tax=Limnospira TaxID=2596745 RepID=UPI000291D4F3|nr:hypothetical protein [Arthrospira platensis PCC 7345]MDT9312657.1 hypothetical protein [Limnospira sp. Paracas R14]
MLNQQNQQFPLISLNQLLLFLIPLTPDEWVYDYIYQQSRVRLTDIEEDLQLNRIQTVDALR